MGHGFGIGQAVEPPFEIEEDGFMCAGLMADVLNLLNNFHQQTNLNQIKIVLERYSAWWHATHSTTAQTSHHFFHSTFTGKFLHHLLHLFKLF